MAINLIAIESQYAAKKTSTKRVRQATQFHSICSALAAGRLDEEALHRYVCRQFDEFAKNRTNQFALSFFL